MSAPYLILTFIDDDADEFPVRVEGIVVTEAAIERGRQLADSVVREGAFRPHGELRYRDAVVA